MKQLQKDDINPTNFKPDDKKRSKNNEEFNKNVLTRS